MNKFCLIRTLQFTKENPMEITLCLSYTAGSTNKVVSFYYNLQVKVDTMILLLHKRIAFVVFHAFVTK